MKYYDAKSLLAKQVRDDRSDTDIITDISYELCKEIKKIHPRSKDSVYLEVPRSSILMALVDEHERIFGIPLRKEYS